MDNRGRVKEFGVYIRRLRKAKDMTQDDLSIITLIPRTTIASYEQGSREPSSDVIRKLSAALGVTHIGMMIKAGHITESEVLTTRSENGLVD